MSRLDWLPAAIRDPHPRSFPWTETTDPKGCLHTTEGSGWPGYDGWTIMPHATVMPTPGKGVTIRQHLPFSQASFALRHTRSQPTNGDYVFQFELIGTCEKGGPGYYWPGADTAVLLDLYLKVIKPLDLAYVIPFKALTFDAYPSETGTHRLTDTQFDTYTGWLGHEHVPQNDHGDPGAFPWARLVAAANAHEKPLEDDMTPAEVAKAVLGAAFREYVDEDHDGIRDSRSVADIIYSSHKAAVTGQQDAAQALDAVAALSTKLDTVITKLDALAAPKPQ